MIVDPAIAQRTYVALAMYASIFLITYHISLHEWNSDNDLKHVSIPFLHNESAR